LLRVEKKKEKEKKKENWGSRNPIESEPFNENTLNG